MLGFFFFPPVFGFFVFLRRSRAWGKGSEGEGSERREGNGRSVCVRVCVCE